MYNSIESDNNDNCWNTTNLERTENHDKNMESARGRYGLAIPSGSRVKRKLFAEEIIQSSAISPIFFPSSITNCSTPINENYSTKPEHHNFMTDAIVPQQFQTSSSMYAEARNNLHISSEITQPLHPYPKRMALGNGISQIAIRKKYNDSPTGWNNEVFLLNGNWDTSHSIPNIVAEMHNVNLAELQCTWGGDEPLTTVPSSDSRDSAISTTSKHSSTPSINNSQQTIINNSNQDLLTDDNFSWLVNFKLDDLIHAATPTGSTSDYGSDLSLNQSSQNSSATSLHSISNSNSKFGQVFIADSTHKQYFSQQNIKHSNGIQLIHDKQMSMLSQVRPNAVVPAAVKTVKMSANNGTHVNRYSGPRKPPFTYTELIEHALREKGELTVSGIYQWISDHFPFYKANDDRWKNSVRHNLSINPHFRKGSKAVHGAGHLWTIAQRDDKKMSTWILKKQRMQQFIDKYDEQEKAMEDELQAATASILPDADCSFNTNNDLGFQYGVQRVGLNGVRTEGLLGAVKPAVEVQYLIPVGESMDFMCPISKEEVAEECGLQSGNDRLERINELSSGDYLITDLNPQTLGLNLSEAEIVIPDQLFGDDLNFQCYELQV